MNEHIRPVLESCSPCDITYDYVIHFENLGEESELLKEIIDPQKKLPTRWVNPNLSGLKSTNLARKYFELLSDSDIDFLYKMYESDFKMFGYKFMIRNMTLPY